MRKSVNETGFRKLVISIMRKRWLSLSEYSYVYNYHYDNLISIHSNVKVDGDWKEVLLLLLGAFLGSFGKVIDYWFSDNEKDKVLFQKMDEEDGESLSNSK